MFLILGPLLRPTSLLITEEDEIDFTVEYIKDAPNGNLSRHKYYTNISVIKNKNITNETEIWSEKHTVKVEGFYVLIMITKRSFSMAPTWMIAGGCDKATLINK